MSSHFDLTDAEFENQFASTQLDPSLFCHEAHLRLAYIHISKYGEEQAIENITSQIWRYVQKLGVEDKFNKTLTVAAIKAVHHFMQKSESDNFKDLIKEFPRLKLRFRDLIAAHYKVGIYNSRIAKQRFLEPDLLAFD
ncbi:hypothetical protein [Gillisia marina]|uniref:hypothetical protein n=1 Tax=Gillisia marina TaxID=1167637 RepID=UPI00029AD6FF|nr:hypothetical protein [Gillisia marina]